MNEVFRDVLRRAEVPQAELFGADEVGRWPKGTLNWLTGAGILRETEPAEEILCTECEQGCWIRPTIRDDPRTGKPVGTYFCRRNDQVGRFTVDLERRRRWAFNLAGLADVVAKAVGATGRRAELESGRLAMLGTVAIDGKTRELFLPRGVAWQDAEVFVRAVRLRAALHPAVLTLADVPARDLLPGRELPARPLSEIASFDGQTLRICLDGVFPDAEPSPWANIPNKPITLDQFMLKYCDERSKGGRRSRRRALLGAARNGTVQMPQLAVPYKNGRPNRYFTHDLLKAWPSFIEANLDLPELLPRYMR